MRCGALLTDLDSPGALVSTKQIGILQQTQNQSALWSTVNRLGFPGCIGEHKTDWNPPTDTETKCIVEHFGRHTRDPAPSDRFGEKSFGDIWQQTVKQTS